MLVFAVTLNLGLLKTLGFILRCARALHPILSLARNKGYDKTHLECIKRIRVVLNCCRVV